jgi:mutator protein MutT
VDKEDFCKNKKHIVAINAIIKNENGKILVVKRNKNEIAFPGKWTLPGGKAERGEKIIEVLKREVKEETNLDIEDYKEYIEDFTFIRPDNHNVIGFSFLVKTKTNKVKINKDFEDYKWIDYKDIDNMDFVDNNKMKFIFEKLKKY